MRINISDSRYDRKPVRRARLERILSELAGRLDGENGPAVNFRNPNWYNNGDALCLGFDMMIPESAGAVTEGTMSEGAKDGPVARQGTGMSDDIKEVN